MTVFSDFLKVLGVEHTEEYSDQAFRTMPFKSLFGFSRLLTQYGIPNEALQIEDKSQLSSLPVPFMAQEETYFVIVTGITKNADGTGSVNLLHFGNPETWTLADFEARSSGVVLLAKPDSDSREPDYARHHLHEVAMKGKRYVMLTAFIFLAVCGFAFSGVWRHISTILLTAVDLAGIVITWFLLLKSLKVKSKAANRICGVLEEGGCDTVLEQKASTFFGLFSWAEVGFSYFALTTLVLFIFPGQIMNLAILNACALPFTVWSIWYQKFRIKTWCTLCVTTQTLLWCQFFCLLLGGWWKGAFPIRLPLFMLGAAFVTAFLGLNAVMTFIKARAGIK